MILAQTERLLLRSFNRHDIEPFFAYRNDPVVARYQGWDIPFPLERATEFMIAMETATPGVPGEWYQVAFEEKATGTVIGDCAFETRPSGIQAQIGYTLARPYQQQGYGSEGVSGLLEYLFVTLNMHRVSAYCDTRNEPSWRLLHKLGFRLEGHYVDNYRDQGAWASEYQYAMLQREWEARQAKI